MLLFRVEMVTYITDDSFCVRLLNVCLSFTDFVDPDKPKSSYFTNAVITEDLEYKLSYARDPQCYICHYNGDLLHTLKLFNN